MNDIEKKIYTFSLILIFVKSFFETLINENLKYLGSFGDFILLFLWAVVFYAAYIVAFKTKKFFLALSLIFPTAIFCIFFAMILTDNLDFSNDKLILTFKVYLAIHLFLIMSASVLGLVFSKFKISLKEDDGR